MFCTFFSRDAVSRNVRDTKISRSVVWNETCVVKNVAYNKSRSDVVCKLSLLSIVLLNN